MVKYVMLLVLFCFSSFAMAAEPVPGPEPPEPPPTNYINMTGTISCTRTEHTHPTFGQYWIDTIMVQVVGTTNLCDPLNYTIAGSSDGFVYVEVERDVVYPSGHLEPYNFAIVHTFSSNSLGQFCDVPWNPNKHYWAHVVVWNGYVIEQLFLGPT